MVVVPQLGGDEQLLPIIEALLQGPAHTLTGLGTVLVVVSAVDMTIAQIYGIITGIGSLLLSDLPNAKAHEPNPQGACSERRLETTVELYGRGGGGGQLRL